MLYEIFQFSKLFSFLTYRPVVRFSGYFTVLTPPTFYLLSSCGVILVWYLSSIQRTISCFAQRPVSIFWNLRGSDTVSSYQCVALLYYYTVSQSYCLLSPANGRSWFHFCNQKSLEITNQKHFLAAAGHLLVMCVVCTSALLVWMYCNAWWY